MKFRELVLLSTMSLLAMGCSEQDLEQPICTELSSVAVADDDTTSAGDSKDSVLAEIGTMQMSVSVDTDSSTFSDTFEWSFEDNGSARLVSTDGSSPIGASCPTGHVLMIPVSITLTASAGMEMEGDGQVLVDGSTGEMWFDLSTTAAETEAPYNASDMCAGEQGSVTELRQGVRAAEAFDYGAGVDEMRGGFDALVETTSGSCSNSFATWQQTTE